MISTTKTRETRKAVGLGLFVVGSLAALFILTSTRVITPETFHQVVKQSGTWGMVE